MRRRDFLTTAAASFALPLARGIGVDQNAGPAPSPLTLWYDRPGGEWTEWLPIGCGRLAAMIQGGIDIERIQFNDDTVWTGGPHDYAHEGAVTHLAEIRRLLFDGKQAEAE